MSLVVGAALAAVAGVALYGSLALPLPPPRVLRYTQITNDGEMKWAPIVTDGIRLYFNELTRAGFMICQVPACGGRPHPLPGSADLKILDISPAGSEVVAMMDNPTGLEPTLYLAPVAGGAPRNLGVSGRAAAWSPDGQRLVYATGSALHSAKADGSESRKLAEVAGVSWIRWSPDGKHIRLTIDEPTRNSIWQISADGTALQPVLPPSNAAGRSWIQNWTPNGRYAFLRQDAGGRGDLWAIRETPGIAGRPGRRVYQLTNGPIDLNGPVSSPDGKKLFALGRITRGELLRWNRESRQLVPWLPGVSADGITFSPDGEWVAYSLWPERTLWRSRTDGSDRLQLTSSPLVALVPRWSPDGRNLAFMARAAGGQGHWNIYLVPASGGGPEPILSADSDHASPSWSPDGRSLAFGGAPWLYGFTKSSTAVRILDLRTRQVSKVAGSEGLWSPKWSPDGRHIVAETIDSLNIMLFDFSKQQWSGLAKIEGRGYIDYICWSRAGDSVYFNTPTSIHRVGLHDRKVALVSSLQDVRLAQSLGEWFGLAPDDSPLVLRDTSIQEIYALDVDLP